MKRQTEQTSYWDASAPAGERCEFGALLHRQRVAAGLSQEELAERAGLSARGISDLERGTRRFPYPSTVQRLAAALRLEGTQRVAFLSARHATSARLSQPPIDSEPRTPSADGSAPERFHNLPLALNNFVGRELEIAEVSEQLRSRRLVTLTGPGGVGKTRLALQVAEAAKDYFANGLVFVPLASIRNSMLVISAIARTLDVREIAGRPLLATLQDALVDRSMLLLLDNFEQVLEAATQVAELLTACPSLTALVTSRAVLHVSGEHDYAVFPLRLPARDSHLSAEDLSQFEAVRLFIERARAARADFAVSSDSVASVSEICQRVDGLPLAIELAAARARVLSPQAILARLGRRLDLLVGGARDQPERHQTLRAAIGWSYDLLAADEQALFRRLAVFAGGCSLEAVERICVAQGGTPPGREPEWPTETLAAMILLVEQGLVQSSAQTDGEPRFFLLETIREYALERLEACGEATHLRRLHGEYYLAFAEQAEVKILGHWSSTHEREWLGRLETEHDNLREVLTWSQADSVVGDGDDPRVEVGLRMAGALARFWFSRGYLDEGRRRLEALLGIPARSGTRARAWALTGAGMLAREQGDYEFAATRFEEGLALGRALGAGRIVASALRQLGQVVQAQGDAQRASALLQESLNVGYTMGDRWEVAQSLHFLGVVVHQQGDLERASVLLEQSVALNRDLEAWFGVSWTLQDWGDLACDQGDYERAATLFAESLELAREMNYTSRSAWALCGLGFIAAVQGEVSRAMALILECLAAFGRLGDRRGNVACLCNLATLAHALGDDRHASRMFGAAEAALETLAAAWWLGDRTRYERVLAAARTGLHKEIFAAARTEGHALSVEGALASALAWGSSCPTANSRTSANHYSWASPVCLTPYVPRMKPRLS